jgi:hypothetical protein
MRLAGHLTLGRQGLPAADGPGATPLIRRLRRHLQQRRDLSRRHTLREHFHRLATHPFPPGTLGLIQATTIAAPH